MTRTLFGTDGVRGVAGQAPMSAETAFALGRATAERLRETAGRPPRIVLGVDTRLSGAMLRHAFTAGAISRGAHVRYAGIVPTPGVAFLARHEGADAGVVISASHNPYQDNGIKIFSSNGDKLPDEEEAAIERWLEAGDEAYPPVTGDAIGGSDRYPSRKGAYREHLLEHAPYLDGLRVGLDCANGAASEIAPELFRRIGARLQVIHAGPDGRNINVECGSTHPSAIAAHVLAHGLDVGVAFDGDADRALLVDARGRLVTGDHILAIVARVRGDAEVVGTVMTNLGVERWMSEHGVTVHRTMVGDRYVHRELVQRGLRLGGEASGHVLFLDKAPTGDGLLTALQLLAAVRASGRSLETWMDQIPSYPQILRNVHVDTGRKHATASHPEVLAAVADAEADLGAEGRVSLRPSGTEPLVRVMVEGADSDRIERYAARLADVVARVGAAS
ncbi:MAG: phosphoglucosamine mutase [Trueperaceae bacterium]|nr:phosphoglucosamine mutase [Trueperaceae bacterium]